MRLIDADKLIDEIDDKFTLGEIGLRQRDDIVDAIEYAETAQPKWVKCSERLPKEGEAVLTQAKFKDDIKMAVSARVDFNYWTGWGTREINIVAWMPLPEPYRGDDND